jgi:hypothetical protein
MSIYDGQCDRAKMIPGKRCPRAATHWAGLGYDSTYCKDDAVSFGNPIAPRTWPDIVALYEANQAHVQSVIAEAERTGQLIERNDNWNADYYTPAQARKVIANGYSMVKVSLANPQTVIADYEREANDAAEVVKEARAKAARLRRAARSLIKITTEAS